MNEPNPTPARLLLEQYKLLEDRSQFFGNQFMKMIGGVGAIFAILVGLLGGKPENDSLLRFTIFVGGAAFLLLAFLSYRLDKRQDDCECVMGEIESTLKSMNYPAVARMPRGARGIGAKRTIIPFLVSLGTSLLVIGLIKG